MNLLQTIINYYQGEARHSFWMALVGGVLVIASIVLWKWASPLTMLKGYSVPMFLFGLIIGVGGGVNSLYTNKAAPGRIALYRIDRAEFLKQEKEKVEKIHRGWTSTFIFWGVLGLIGLLSLFIRKPFWIGVGLVTVGLAVCLSLFELYSMLFNERYYQVIRSVAEI